MAWVGRGLKFQILCHGQGWQPQDQAAQGSIQPSWTPPGMVCPQLLRATYITGNIPLRREPNLTTQEVVIFWDRLQYQPEDWYRYLCIPIFMSGRTDRRQEDILTQVMLVGNQDRWQYRTTVLLSPSTALCPAMFPRKYTTCWRTGFFTVIAVQSWLQEKIQRD